MEGSAFGIALQKSLQQTIAAIAIIRQGINFVVIMKVKVPFCMGMSE